MDERELTRLFQDAADDAPPARFDVDDVAAASRRATARRRMRIAAVTSITAVVLAGAGFVAATSPFSGGGEEAGSVVSARGEAGVGAGQPSQQDMRLENGESPEPPAALSKQGDSAAEAQADMAAGIAGTERCAEVDRRLATALAGELPVDPDHPDPVPGQLCFRTGGSAAFHVTDGDARGLVMVAHLPGRPSLTVTLAGRAGVATARTPSGGMVIVASTPDDGSSAAPFAGELQRIAAAVAATR